MLFVSCGAKVRNLSETAKYFFNFFQKIASFLPLTIFVIHLDNER